MRNAIKHFPMLLFVVSVICAIALLLSIFGILNAGFTTTQWLFYVSFFASLLNTILILFLSRAEQFKLFLRCSLGILAVLTLIWLLLA